MKNRVSHDKVTLIKSTDSFTKYVFQKGALNADQSHFAMGDPISVWSLLSLSIIIIRALSNST